MHERFESKILNRLVLDILATGWTGVLWLLLCKLEEKGSLLRRKVICWIIHPLLDMERYWSIVVWVLDSVSGERC
jgi:hypothetical protein